jgi:hypothetical protein
VISQEFFCVQVSPTTLAKEMLIKDNTATAFLVNMESKFLLLSDSEMIILSLSWVTEKCQESFSNDLGFFLRLRDFPVATSVCGHFGVI